METLVFRCSQTGSKVQIEVVAAPVAEHADAYEVVACAACGCLHLVNKATGKMLSDREEPTCPTLPKS